MDENDGGYYAIKGFSFQIDKSILEVLGCVDENKQISIEQIQDINADDFVTQIKYKETQNYSPSKVRDPIIQLVDQFQVDQRNAITRKYYLYAFFRNKDESAVDLSIEDLNSILGSQSSDFSTTVKKKFIASFQVIFSPTFQDQFNQVLVQLKGISAGMTEEESLYHYASAAHYIQSKVTQNKDSSQRVITKKEIIHFLLRGKYLICDSGFKEFLGAQKYLRFLKSHFIKPKKNNNSIIFLGLFEVDQSVSIEKIVQDIVDSFFTSACVDIKPLTFIIHDSIVNEVKTALINAGIRINDGYESINFNQNLFFQTPIINRKTRGNGHPTDSLDKISFKCRIVSATTFLGIDKESIKDFYQMSYCFGTDIQNDLRIPVVSISQISTKELNQIFTI
jgi:hypothetical protein